jgi:hypothetical protein
MGEHHHFSTQGQAKAWKALFFDHTVLRNKLDSNTVIEACSQRFGACSRCHLSFILVACESLLSVALSWSMVVPW